MLRTTKVELCQPNKYQYFINYNLIATSPRQQCVTERSLSVDVLLVMSMYLYSLQHYKEALHKNRATSPFSIDNSRKYYPIERI